MQLNSRVRVAHIDPITFDSAPHSALEDVVYVVRGFDSTANRVWLSVEDPGYDGYNGDIIAHVPPSNKRTYQIALADSRCNIPTQFALHLIG